MLASPMPQILRINAVWTVTALMTMHVHTTRALMVFATMIPNLEVVATPLDRAEEHGAARPNTRVFLRTTMAQNATSFILHLQKMQIDQSLDQQARLILFGTRKYDILFACLHVRHSPRNGTNPLKLHQPRS